MNKYDKLAKNTVIFAVGNFGSKIITLLMLPFYTRQLSQAEYGQIDMIITTITLLIPLFTINIVEAIVRFSLDKKNYSYGEVITNSTMIVVLGFLLLSILYPFIDKISFISQYIFIFYILFCIQSLHTSVKQFTRSINLSKIFMISDLLYTLVFVTCNIFFLLFLEMGVQGYLISMIIAYSIDFLFLSFKTKINKYIHIKYLDKMTMKKMAFFCLPLIPNTLMWWVMSISDRYILAYYIGLSATGLYAVANVFPSFVSTIHGLFFKAWQVSAIEEHESSDKDEFYTNVFSLFFFCMLILSSIYIIFNKLIVMLLVSNEFYSVWKYTPILVLGVVFSSFSSFIGTNYVAMKKPIGALYTALIGAIINFLLNLLFIPHFGLYGASISTMISFVIMWILRSIDTRKFVEIKYPIKKMILSFFLIGIQLMINYSDVGFLLKQTINCSILFFIILISLKYTQKPFMELFYRLRRRI